jgi:hypothetical protein
VLPGALRHRQRHPWAAGLWKVSADATHNNGRPAHAPQCVRCSKKHGETHHPAIGLHKRLHVQRERPARARLQHRSKGFKRPQPLPIIMR